MSTYGTTKEIPMGSAPKVYSTADGGTVEAVRRGQEIDLHYRESSGRTVATVVMSDWEAWPLIENLIEVAP